MKTIYGIKANMTQAWDNSGKRVAVTIVKTPAMIVTAVKSKEKDGYDAIQVGIGERPAKRVNKPLAAQLKAAIQGEVFPKYLKEIRIDSTEASVNVGENIPVETIINVGDRVNVSGVTRGHGFEGAMKRWGFRGGPKTHGQSDRARAPGSIGQGTSPGRIHKGKKMAGHYGSQTHYVKNITVVKIDSEKQEIWLSGPVPGSDGTVLEVMVSGKTKFSGLREAVEVEKD